MRAEMISTTTASATASTATSTATSTRPAPTRERLRIAIQKSGRLAAAARELLASCGLTWSESRDRLFCYGENLPVDLLLVRDDDIPGLIADGVCDLGILGRNVALEFDVGREADGKTSRFTEWRALGFGSCRLDLAVPEAWDWDVTRLEGSRIATSYPNLLSRWLAEKQIGAHVVHMSGSVEIAPRLGQADLICDLVSSGATLTGNQLKPVVTLLDSEAVLVGTTEKLDDVRGALAEQLLRRLDGALHVRDSRLLMFRSPRSRLEEVLPLLPSGGEPMVTRIEGGDEVSLQVLCYGTVSWSRLEELKRAGASGLMVLPVEGMLA